MSQSPINVIFFDWDRTLAYHQTAENTFGERMTMMFNSAGLCYSRDEIEAGLHQHALDVEQGKISYDANPQTRREIAELYRYLLGYLEHPDKSWPLLIRLYNSYALLPTFLFDDSRKTLKRLKESGYDLGIISNHSQSARVVIEEMVGDLIPARHLIISEEVGVHKPAKTIFRTAVSRLHATPDSCLLVGDNLEVDAIGSVERGGFGRGVWLDRHNHENGQILPDNVSRITTLSQLPDLLEKAG